MRRLYLCGMMAAATLLYSCHKDTEIEYRDVIVHDTVKVTETEYVEGKTTGYYYDNKPLIVTKSDTVIVSYGDIEVGTIDNDIMFEFNHTIQDAVKGRHKEYTLCCAALGALPLAKTAEGDTIFVDTDDSETGYVAKTPMVENVTIINRGKITIHTKALVEKYKNEIQTADNTEPKYVYLQCLAMFGLKNNKFINEGVIEFVFDHDASCTSTVYGIGCSTGGGCLFLNSGQIKFTGTGNRQTRFRAAATYGPRNTFQNKGKISADVEMCDDSRLFTTGGDLTNVINDGQVDVNLAGTTFLFTRYDKATIINNGTINATYRSWPAEYQGSTGNMLAVLYEPVTKSHVNQLPMVNKGTINVKIDENSPANSRLEAYGMVFDLTVSGDNLAISNIDYDVVNTGLINCDKNGKECTMAEVGFRTSNPAANGGNTINVAIGTWRTVLRDFSQAPIFAGSSLNIDLSVAKLVLDAPSDYTDGTEYSIDPEKFIYNLHPEQSVFNVIGYDQMEVKPYDFNNYDVVVDKTNKTVALKKIEATAK